MGCNQQQKLFILKRYFTGFQLYLIKSYHPQITEYTVLCRNPVHSSVIKWKLPLIFPKQKMRSKKKQNTKHQLCGWVAVCSVSDIDVIIIIDTVW